MSSEIWRERVKGNGYTFKGDNAFQRFWLSAEEGVYS